MKGVYLRRKKYWYRFSWMGKQRFVNLGTSDEVEAISRALQVRNDPAQWIAGKDFVDSLLTEYLELKRSRGISESRIENLALRLRSFFRQFGIKHPTEITESKITQWMDGHWKRNNATGNEYRGNIASFTRWLYDHGQLVKDPCQNIPRRKERLRVRKRFLRKEQCRKLLDSCQDPDLKLCLYFALHCGLRKGECLQVKSHWIDLDAGLLHVQANEDWQPKDRDNRTIPLTRELAEYVRPFVDREPFLIRPDKVQGKSVYRWNFRKPFNALADSAGIADLHFHDLRRTFASLHVSAGTSIYKVAKWLGDGVSVVENHYGHLIPNDDEINRAWD